MKQKTAREVILSYLAEHDTMTIGEVEATTWHSWPQIYAVVQKLIDEGELCEECRRPSGWKGNRIVVYRRVQRGADPGMIRTALASRRPLEVAWARMRPLDVLAAIDRELLA